MPDRLSWADEAVSSTVDVGCLSAAQLACQLFDVQGRSQHLVSDGLDLAGVHVDTNSDAYHDGQIAFVVASIVTPGAVGALSKAAKALRAGSLLFGGAPEAAAQAAEEGTITLYHGTTRAAATRIIDRGFRPGYDGAVYLGEDLATANYFATEAVAERGAISGTILTLRVPQSLASSFGMGLIGEARGARFVDIPGGTGFERIVAGDALDALNSGIRNGLIDVRRFASWAL